MKGYRLDFSFVIKEMPLSLGSSWVSTEFIPEEEGSL